jgi:heterodisulfide reductase subunit A-like polyferredoxin
LFNQCIYIRDKKVVSVICFTSKTHINETKRTIIKIKTNYRMGRNRGGGGASGLGTALDAASRGYKTILVEAVDFAKGTSSRSTKLVHGGVRYLEQVTSLLLERLLKREA